MGLVILAATAWLLFLVSTGLLFSIVFFGMRRSMRRLHPDPRADILRVIAVGPVAFASLGLMLCFAPKLVAGRSSGVDHCHQHADTHAHFCLIHRPDGAVYGADLQVGLMVLGLAILTFVGTRLWRLRRSSESLRQLVRTARPDAARQAWWIETEQPVALSVGVMRSQTLLSSGLMKLFPERLLDSIVMHERAHARRRDGLWRIVTELMSFGHMPSTRRMILSELELACEQACDEEAGEFLGDRVQIAEALLAMERLRQDTREAVPAALAFGEHQLPARVESLLAASPGHRSTRRWMVALGLGAVLGAILVADPLHHFTESLIHHIAG